MGNQQAVNGAALPPGVGPDSQQQGHHQQQQQHHHQQQQQHGHHSHHGQQQQQHHPQHAQQQQQHQYPAAYGARSGSAGGGAGNPMYYTPGYAPPGSGALPPGMGGGRGGVGGGGMSGDPGDMPRSTSDASMTMMDASNNMGSSSSSAVVGAGGATGIENWLDDDTVPTVFRWEHGGRQVYITGTFNGWSRQIPMHRSGNDFTYIHNLKRGKHAFKFIVDDEWRFAPDQPTVADIEGRINNFIDVTGFKPYTGDKEFEKEKAAAEYGAPALGLDDAFDGTGPGAGAGGGGIVGGDVDPGAAPGGAGASTGAVGGGDTKSDSQSAGSTTANRADRDGEVFSHNMPDVDDYTKEPPPLPPHLRHIILNKPPQLQDTAALPVPQHVALNHLYCTAIKDNMMVLGITQRFKTKFVTTVYYSPCESK